MNKKQIIKKILIILISLMFLLSAYTKLSSSKTIVEMLSKLNLSSYKNSLGLIDLIIALSLWSKRTRRIAIMIGTAYLGGAIACELSLGGSGLIPGITMLMLWIVQKIDLWQWRLSIKKNTPTVIQ